MAKKIDLKAAKAAKQKKIAIGGGGRVPRAARLLGAEDDGHAPRPVAQATSTSSRHSTLTATGTTDDVDADDGHGAVPVVPVPTGPAVLTAQLAPAAREGQLRVLSASFKSKDPFRQLIDEDAETSTPAPRTRRRSRQSRRRR